MTAASNVEVVGHSSLRFRDSTPSSALMLCHSPGMGFLLFWYRRCMDASDPLVEMSMTPIFGIVVRLISKKCLGELEALESAFSQGFLAKVLSTWHLAKTKRSWSHGATRLVEVMASREMRAACLLDEGYHYCFIGSLRCARGYCG